MKDLSLPLKILLRTVANIVLVYVLATYLPQYFLMTGGFAAAVVVGILISFLNVLIRPVLSIVLLPFKLFASILFHIIVNGVILWLVENICLTIDPSLLTFTIPGGFLSWVVASLIFGFGNWIIKEIIHK